jgi:serine/threonine protein phosphatase 1
MATYVVGDTHGCLSSLRFLLEQEIGISQSDKIVLLGDLIDRGPYSAQLIDYIIKLQLQGLNIMSIRGNHDQMLLDAKRSGIYFNNWIMNGGDSTLKSYEDFCGEAFIFPKDIPEIHLSFLEQLPYYTEIDQFVLVHGGINVNVSNPFDDTESLLWSRMGSLPNDFMPNKIFVYGHTPTPLENIRAEVEKPDNRLIPLDGGCVYAGMRAGVGFLSALELESFTLHWVANQE